ncbi:MAG: adenylate/guanylate cyclase domain-containing protein [Candidatus Edwardsbacteria bacterium]
MMKEMAKFKRIETGVGQFDVLMKVAVASGEWNEVILGDNRRKELFLDGKAVRALIFMEESAKSGEILVKDGTQTKSIRRQPQSYKTQNFAPFLPQGVQAFVEKEAIGEHRAVTAVFINFDGYDEEEPQVNQLQYLFTNIISITEKYRGSLARINAHKKGSNLMLLFGAPISHGDDAEHGVLASMEISKLNIKPLRISTGMCSGFVYAGIVGSAWRKEYTVMGDAVNTAERLMETAKQTEVVVSESTYNLTHAKINYEEIKSAKVKGKEALLKRYVPKSIIEEKSFLFQFIGREIELQELADYINKGGLAIIVTGDAGVGKSRLLYEIKKKYEQTHKVLQGNGDEIKGSLHLFASMIAKEANIHTGEPETVQKEKLDKHISEVEKKRRAEKDAKGGELARRLSFIEAMLFGIREPDSLYEKIEAKLAFENLCDAIRYYIEYQINIFQ